MGAEGQVQVAELQLWQRASPEQAAQASGETGPQLCGPQGVLNTHPFLLAPMKEEAPVTYRSW